MAPPLRLTEKVRNEMCRLLRTGMPISFVCGRVGVHRDTYFGWLERAKDVKALLEEGREVRPIDRDLLARTTDLEIARAYGGGWLYEQMIGAPANVWTKYCAAMERQFHDDWSSRGGATAMSVHRRKDGAVEVKFAFEAAPELVEELREK